MMWGRVQKIQQITILKNALSAANIQHEFKKYNKLQSLRTNKLVDVLYNEFKKYNKLQSLRTFVRRSLVQFWFKKYNKLQSLRTVIRIIPQKDFNYRLFEHFPDRTSNKKSSNHHLIDYHIP